jgi:hypothetical protein
MPPCRGKVTDERDLLPEDLDVKVTELSYVRARYPLLDASKHFLPAGSYKISRKVVNGSVLCFAVFVRKVAEEIDYNVYMVPKGEH